MNFAEFTELSLILLKRGDAGKQARARLASYVETKYLADTKVLAKLGLDRCRALSAVLGKLGSKQAPAVFPLWVEKTDAWQSLNFAGLAKLSLILSKRGDAGKQARARLVGHIEAKFLADAKTIRSALIDNWNLVAGSVAKDLSKEARGAWAEKLHSAFLVGAAKPKRAKALRVLLAKLGYRRDPAGDAAIVEKTDAWQVGKPADLVYLGTQLARLGDRSKAARVRMAEHIEATYLKDNAAVTTVTCGQWLDFAACFAETLSAESRKRWIARLRATYVDDAKRFTKLKSGQALALSKALGELGDPKSLEVVTDWFSATKP